MPIQPFKLERYFAKYEFNAPYLLCCSDCEALTAGDLLRMEKDAELDFKDLWLGYTESQGHPELREEIAKLYRGITADQVLVHTGAEEAIHNAMHVLLTPGDHVVVQYPCYQSLAEVALSIGCGVSFWKMENSPEWTLDADLLEKHVTNKTKLIIINSPHNPTGYQMPMEQFQYVRDVANARGITLFSDEVYRLLELDVKDRLPSLCEIDENGLALGVMSKSFGLAGLRIGWVVTRNRDLCDKLAFYKDYTTICNSAPSEYLSMIALKHKEGILARNMRIIVDNLERLNEFFRKYPSLFSWKAPKAGPIAFPELKTGNVTDFCHDLVTKAGVLLLPGTLYDPSYNHFRIGYGRANLYDVLLKLEEYLKSAGITSE